jgi:chromosome segregation ATPase
MNSDTLPTGLSVRERVFRICNQLYAENTKVKIRTVLELLPDIKSTSTVHKYHKEWRTELDNSKRTLFDSFGFSDNFQNAFVSEIARFHTDAKNEYSEKLVELTEERDTAILGLEKADNAIITQQTRADTLEDQVRELQNEIHLLTREAKQHSEQLEKDKAFAIGKLEQQMGDLEKRLNNENRLVVEQLQHQIDSLTTKNNELREVNENQRTELAKSQLKLESNTSLVEEVKARATAAAEEAKARIEKLESSFTTLSEKHITCSQALAVANEKLAAKDELLVNSLGQYELAINNETSLRLLLNDREEEQKELRARLARVERDDSNAQAEVRRLTERQGEMKNKAVTSDKMISELNKSIQNWDAKYTKLQTEYNRLKPRK